MWEGQSSCLLYSNTLSWYVNLHKHCHNVSQIIYLYVAFSIILILSTSRVDFLYHYNHDHYSWLLVIKAVRNLALILLAAVHLATVSQDPPRPWNSEHEVALSACWAFVPAGKQQIQTVFNPKEDVWHLILHSKCETNCTQVRLNIVLSSTSAFSFGTNIHYRLLQALRQMQFQFIGQSIL